MPGAIQSIERAAAVLRILGGAGRPLRLSEIADALDLPKPTVFGIVRTLRDVGFVHQDRSTSEYSLGDGVRNLHESGLDPHDLRSHAMSWTDALASRTHLEVHIGVPDPGGARIVHHVFRPDDSTQQLRVGEVLPFHASAMGKVMLGFVAGTPTRARVLDRYTQRTLVNRSALDADMHGVRERGWASERGELLPEVGAVAVPLRGYGGIGVGALAVVGPLERVFRHAGPPLADIVDATVDTAVSISRSLGLQA
ncbi:IclR family transcriptional regulator [Aeromicrobium sp.]|uniref:IclR family transcriptional regulator n=1 Tax=Aeromicrobium sp. TaxID=1871063 RepID=UPI00199F88B1|nr:IclR family transcriptional regulator [Aeromicrobium sp.]MBC7630079.1 IclR family transcriptional regulator [Aeromicrobium sp.]